MFPTGVAHPDKAVSRWSADSLVRALQNSGPTRTGLSALRFAATSAWLFLISAARLLGSETNEWWAVKPLIQPSIPSVSAKAPDSKRNPIDAFIRTALGPKGLSPSPEADRRALLRRVYFDLIG